MKIAERGRAKFRPEKNIDEKDVRSLLQDKIAQEQSFAAQNGTEITREMLAYEPPKFNLVSLFSGCGGLDLGAELAGMDVVIGRNETNQSLLSREAFDVKRNISVFHTVASLDNFPEANQSYKDNFPKHILQIKEDIRKVNKFPLADIVLGGFPCPGFSEGGPRLIDDPRNFLYLHFIRCLMQAKPLFFVAENVKGMLTLGKGAVAEQIKQDFESAGYKVKMKLTNSRDYGVPQLRERVFLIGVRSDIDFEYQFPSPSHGEGEGLQPFISLREAIGDLEASPGEFFTGSYSPIYLSRNRKKKWSEQSFTIQASGRQAPLHPSGSDMIKLGKDEWHLPEDSLHRRLSVKEISRIQTFPDWFNFSKGINPKGSINNQLNKQYKQIGNAVPVELARSIIEPIAQWCSEHISDVSLYRKS
ncbi:DNA cytosine methyltransferase [Thalassotalea sp. LPB0316]|uniref:DNA cytosine methyltransferase n=1 Tax=Thalassotalea sp. LPB0316 TaxID=2769490 RepID=UPI0018677DF6|nr:DNA cytosine methyltransferase [Thalassotalea sp. LPB0316]QOL26235.1 DNA cytosine methyltransferase [Thalassotalea sp. LPB0316]